MAVGKVLEWKLRISKRSVERMTTKKMLGSQRNKPLPTEATRVLCRTPMSKSGDPTANMDGPKISQHLLSVLSLFRHSLVKNPCINSLFSSQTYTSGTQNFLPSIFRKTFPYNFLVNIGKLFGKYSFQEPVSLDI